MRNGKQRVIKAKVLKAKVKVKAKAKDKEVSQVSKR